MKNWLLQVPTPARHLLLAMMGAAAVLVLLYTLMLVSVFSDGIDSIDATYPRIARLMGLSGAEAELSGAASLMRSSADALSFPVEMDRDQAAAQLQEALRDIAQSAGLDIGGSQLVQQPRDPEEEAAFDPISVRLSMTGSPVEVNAFLHELHKATPMLIVEALDLSKQRMSARQRARMQRNNQRVDETLIIVNTRVTAYHRVAMP